MLNKVLLALAGLLVLVLFADILNAQPQLQPVPRPLLLTKERYYCLIKYADQLAVSSRGNLVDISTCPPRIELGFTPRVTLMDNYLTLSPVDVQCLLRARRGGQRIAFKSGQRAVAVYLRPCGARR